MSSSHGIARDQLKAIVERVERIEADIADLNADKSEIYKEARANGFDVKAIKKVVSKRKIDEHEREEQDLIFETYWDAVHGTSLVHAHARENIEEFDSETGEILNADGGLNIITKHTEITLSAERVSPETDGSAAANVGGGDVERNAERVPVSNIGEVRQILPSNPLRPHCLKPDACGGYGSKHCHACTVAARENEAAA